MKQVLIYLVEFLKEHHEMSMSEISKGLGKSRNFIQQALARGYENEEKYKSLIADLDYQFFVSGDYADFLKFMENKHQEEIHKTETSSDKIVDHLHERVESYQVALKQSLESNLEEMEKKNKTISDLEHRIVVLSRNVDKGWKRTESQNGEIVKLNNTIATKDLFIDGQDEEIEKLKEYQYNERTSLLSSIKILSDDIENHKKSMEALAKAGHSTGASLRKAETKNRILTGALIGVGLLWAVSAWVMS